MDWLVRIVPLVAVGACCGLPLVALLMAAVWRRASRGRDQAETVVTAVEER